MERMILLTILAFSVASQAACTQKEDVPRPNTEVTSSTENKSWKLVWTDEFDGMSIDSQAWSPVSKNPGVDWCHYMAPNRKDLAYIDNGQLVLLGKVDGNTFVTGGVMSQGKKAFKCAKFEIRAKFNSIQGFWPAIWLMPDPWWVSWPDGGEIDIMEHINHESKVSQTVHSKYTQNVSKSEPNHSKSASINPAQWNTYAVEVYSDVIIMYVNGEKTLSYPKMSDKQDQYPFSDYPYYLILSNQLEGEWAGNVTNPSDLPSELRIDWVKVYEFVP